MMNAMQTQTFDRYSYVGDNELLSVLLLCILHGAKLHEKGEHKAPVRSTNVTMQVRLCKCLLNV